MISKYISQCLTLLLSPSHIWVPLLLLDGDSLFTFPLGTSSANYSIATVLHIWLLLYCMWQYTFILTASKYLPKHCTNYGPRNSKYFPRKNIGVRLPDDPVTKAILEKLDAPLISTRFVDFGYYCLTFSSCVSFQLAFLFCMSSLLQCQVTTRWVDNRSCCDCWHIWKRGTISDKSNH